MHMVPCTIPWRCPKFMKRGATYLTYSQWYSYIPIFRRRQWSSGCWITGTSLPSTKNIGLQHTGDIMQASTAASAGPQSGAEPQLPARRQVVTAWVQREDGRVAVVQRSGAVNSYQYKWGGISGGVEGNEPLILRCMLEIEEEVGVPRSRLEVVRAGRPQLVGDGNRRFAVHPFLFRLVGGDVPALTLNWESVDARWVSPHQLQELDTVPDLTETLRRVLVSPQEERWLDRFRRDRSHGAAQMVFWVLDAFEEWGAARPQSPQSRAAEMTALQNYGWHLACARPSMAPVAVAAVFAVTRTQGLLDADSSLSVGSALIQAVTELRSERIRIAARLREASVKQFLGLRDVLTMSLSSTVRDVLVDVASSGTGDPPLYCVVCESRPLFEGLGLATALRQAGAHVAVITEAQVGCTLPHVQAALVGADAITPSGLINKVGTLPLALTAKHLGTPLYGIADTWKVSPGPIALISHPQAYVEGGEGEEKPASELTSAWLAASCLHSNSSSVTGS
eukprot:jgi/Botrbrau1/9663/Bobra.0131s0034.2